MLRTVFHPFTKRFSDPTEISHGFFASRFDANRYAKLLGLVGPELVAIHLGRNVWPLCFFCLGEKDVNILLGDFGVFLLASFGQ